jgi:CheY-like chemotaxis protein
MPTKILAIDDSKTMRLAIKITFAAEDCEVVAVSKGSEAVARAKQMPADVLIVDANLAAGEPSGYDVARAVRADPDTAHIPVLLLVSAQAGIDEGQVQASGANGAMTKPFDTQELLERVTALVTGKAVPKTAPAPRAIVSTSTTPGSSGGSSIPAKTAAPPAASAAPAASKPAAPPLGLGAKSAPPATPAPSAIRGVPASPVTSAGGASGSGQKLPAAFTSVEDMASKIPIAVPIPFASASAPTAGHAQAPAGGRWQRLRARPEGRAGPAGPQPRCRRAGRLGSSS